MRLPQLDDCLSTSERGEAHVGNGRGQVHVCLACPSASGLTTPLLCAISHFSLPSKGVCVILIYLYFWGSFPPFFLLNAMMHSSLTYSRKKRSAHMFHFFVKICPLVLLGKVGLGKATRKDAMKGQERGSKEENMPHDNDIGIRE
jgi:hypothetical protein